MTTTSNLRWKRTEHGDQVADDATHRYVVRHTATEWLLEIFTLRVTAGVRHTVGQAAIAVGEFETRRRAYAVANNYSALGDNFASHLHGGQSRRTVAILAAYDADKDQP
jgi:hypothetical protein